MDPCKYLFATIIIMALICSSAVNALRCWRCSTDVSNGEFCNDPFDIDNISEQQRYWSFVNCTYSAGVKSVNARPVCKKLVQEVYGKRVITRSCFYEDVDDSADKCGRDSATSYIQTTYCQTCSTDGCNGARSTDSISYVVLLILSAFIIKSLY